MRETLRLLRGLQELDRDLYQVRDELKRLPEERDRRRAKIDSAIATRDELDGQVRLLKAKIKEIEDATTTQRQRIRKLENESASGKADTALVVAFQHEMRSLKREISQAEEEGLALVERLSDAEALLEGQNTAIESEETDFAEYSGNIDSELASAQAKRDALEAERDERLAGRIGQDVLAQYQKLLDAREGEALSELSGRVCQGCYTQVPSNVYVRLARALELVECPSCGRILHLPDEQ